MLSGNRSGSRRIPCSLGMFNDLRSGENAFLVACSTAQLVAVVPSESPQDMLCLCISVGMAQFIPTYVMHNYQTYIDEFKNTVSSFNCDFLFLF